MKLRLTFDLSAEKELAERADRMTPDGPPVQLDALAKSIHFLRRVDSRANFVLPTFYLFLASSVDATNRPTIEGYPGKIFQSYLHHASFNNIALTYQ